MHTLEAGLACQQPVPFHCFFLPTLRRHGDLGRLHGEYAFVQPISFAAAATSNMRSRAAFAKGTVCSIIFVSKGTFCQRNVARRCTVTLKIGSCFSRPAGDRSLNLSIRLRGNLRPWISGCAVSDVQPARS